MAKLLIRYGSDVNARDITGRGPLFHAVIKNFREMSDILIANMASVFMFDYHGNSVSSVSLDVGIKLQLEKGKMVSFSSK